MQQVLEEDIFLEIVQQIVQAKYAETMDVEEVAERAQEVHQTVCKAHVVLTQDWLEIVRALQTYVKEQLVTTDLEAAVQEN